MTDSNSGLESELTFACQMFIDESSPGWVYIPTHTHARRVPAVQISSGTSGTATIEYTPPRWASNVFTSARDCGANQLEGGGTVACTRAAGSATKAGAVECDLQIVEYLGVPDADRASPSAGPDMSSIFQQTLVAVSTHTHTHRRAYAAAGRQTIRCRTCTAS